MIDYGSRKDFQMKAIVWTQYGPPDVLQLQEIAKPAPKDDEVLIRIHAATVTIGDCELRGLKFPLAFRLHDTIPDCHKFPVLAYVDYDFLPEHAVILHKVFHRRHQHAARNAVRQL